jgi:acetyl esterase/lipase
MDVSMDNASQNPAPFVDQRPNGPGVSKIDPSDPAAPMYRLLAKMRSPVTLRDLMIHPVRTGYIGQEQPLTAVDLPKSAAELHPEIGVSEVAVPSPAGRIRCQVFSPPPSAFGGGARPMMLYLHGGGFTVGQSEDTAYITSRIAAENTMVVVSANYRLAPEWPFPACLDDCLAVLQWMQKNGATLGGDGTRIAVGGDSAGGNLAAALVIKARDEGVSLPQATVLLAPITDFSSNSTSRSSAWRRWASFMIPPSSGSSAALISCTVRTGRTRMRARRERTCATILPRSSPLARPIRLSTTTAPSRRSCARPGAKRSSTSFASVCRTASISFPACSSKATKPSRPSRRFSSERAQLDGARGGTGGGPRLAAACILVVFRRYRGGRLAVDEPLANRVRSGRKQP